MTVPTLDDTFVDDTFAELMDLEIHLDDDPLVYGPKRLNSKIAATRRMLARCERIFLDVSHRLHSFRRAHRAAATDLDLAKKDLMTNDVQVRAGQNITDRDAIASVKLRVDVQATADLEMGVKDLEAVLSVVKAKRSDLRDTQGRLRDQTKLCLEEVGLGSRWGSRSPRAIELEPNQGFATGADSDAIDDLIGEIGAASEAESHVSADVDDSEDPGEEAAIVASAVDVEEAPAEPEPLPDADPEMIPGTDLVKEFGFVPHCETCGEMQFRAVGHGMTCPNGHGGATTVEPKDAVDTGAEEPAAEAVLPGTSSSEDVDAFLADLAEGGPPSDQVKDKKALSRREIEDEDELDIESLLATF